MAWPATWYHGVTARKLYMLVFGKRIDAETHAVNDGMVLAFDFSGDPASAQPYIAQRMIVENGRKELPQNVELKQAIPLSRLSSETKAAIINRYLPWLEGETDFQGIQMLAHSLGFESAEQMRAFRAQPIGAVAVAGAAGTLTREDPIRRLGLRSHDAREALGREGIQRIG